MLGSGVVPRLREGPVQIISECGSKTQYPPAEAESLGDVDPRGFFFFFMGVSRRVCLADELVAILCRHPLGFRDWKSLNR